MLQLLAEQLAQFLSSGWRPLVFIVGILMVIYSYMKAVTKHQNLVNMMDSKSNITLQEAMLSDLVSGPRLAMAAEYPIMSRSLGYVNPNTARYASYAVQQFPNGVSRQSIIALIYAAETNPNYGIEQLFNAKNGIDPSLSYMNATRADAKHSPPKGPGGLLGILEKYQPLMNVAFLVMPFIA